MKSHSFAGRSVGCSPDSSSEVVLAVDIGGTKMAAALVDDEASVLLEQQVLTPVSDDAEVVFGALARVIDDVVGRAARLLWHRHEFHAAW